MEHAAIEIIALVVGAVAVAGLSRRLKVSAPILLVLVGLAVSFVPGIPEYELDPELVLVFFLPPLLYSAALESSYVGFRANLRPIGLLSVGLVVATTVVVGYAVHWTTGLPLAVAFVLGAIVAPPDAVAATAVGRTLGLPRRLLTILGGESLVNDGTALTAYRVGLAAVVGGGVSLLSGVGAFVVAMLGGIAVGLVLAPAFHWLRQRLVNPVQENVLSIVTPFIAYLVAEELHYGELHGALGVLSVVVVGLYLGHRESQTSFAARLQARAVWKMVDLLLESVVFALIGLQLRTVLEALREGGGYSPATLAWYSFVTVGVVIAVRFLWVFPATYLPRRISARIREREPEPPWTYPTVVSWAGMRGVVSLAAAFAIPEVLEDGRPFPGRDLVLYLTFCVVLGTLVLQGLTLPWLIRRLGVVGQESYGDNLAEADAQHRAIRAAIERLDALIAEEDPEPPHGVEERLRAWAEARQLGAWERLGGGAGPGARETPMAAFRRLRREMLVRERDVFVEMRDSGRIDDEVLRRVMYELDLEEAMLQRD